MNTSIVNNVHAATQFNHPEGVAVDSDGYVYVVDTTNNQIQKFSKTGTFIRK